MFLLFFFSSRRRHTRCALVTGVQTCALPIWGIFLAEPEKDRKVNFGDHKGEDAWQEVPGEYRGVLRRLIVTQGDTEPASVEQQRLLGQTCPSLYDMRNLFQVNVEEGRHPWEIGRAHV